MAPRTAWLIASAAALWAGPLLAGTPVFTQAAPDYTTSSSTWDPVPGSTVPFDGGVDGALLLVSGTLSCVGNGDPCAEAELQVLPGSNWAHFQASSLTGTGASRMFNFDFTNYTGSTVRTVVQTSNGGTSATVSNLKYFVLPMPPGAGVVFTEFGPATTFTANATSWSPVLTARANATGNHLVLWSVEAGAAAEGVGLRLSGVSAYGTQPLPFLDAGNRGFYVRDDGSRTTWTNAWFGLLQADAGVSIQAIAQPRNDGGTVSGPTALISHARLALIPSAALGSPVGGTIYPGFPLTFDAGTPAVIGANTTLGGFTPGESFFMLGTADLGVIGPRARVTSRFNGVDLETTGESRATSGRQLPVSFVDVVTSLTPFVNPVMLATSPAGGTGVLWGGQWLVFGPVQFISGGPTAWIDHSLDGGFIDGGFFDAGSPPVFDAGPGGGGGGGGGGLGGAGGTGGSGGAGGSGGGADDAGAPDAGPLDDGGLRSSDGGLPDGGSAPHSYLLGCGCFGVDTPPTLWIGLGIWLAARRRTHATFGVFRR